MKTIGLSGLATSGKDFFFDLLSKEVKCHRFSLAGALKRTLRNKVLEEYDIDVFNCTAKEKETIRPVLVEYGRKKRTGSEGRFWIEKLNRIIEGSEIKKDEIVVITDIRYNIYHNDEAQWIKNELRGVLVYIKKYKLIEKNIRIYTSPPNDEEKRNNPLVRSAADYTVDWEHVNSNDLEEIRVKLRPHIIKFLNWYEDKCKKKT